MTSLNDFYFKNKYLIMHIINSKETKELFQIVFFLREQMSWDWRIETPKNDENVMKFASPSRCHPTSCTSWVSGPHPPDLRAGSYASRNRKDISATNFGGLTKTPGEAKIEKYKYSAQMTIQMVSYHRSIDILISINTPKCLTYPPEIS